MAIAADKASGLAGSTAEKASAAFQQIKDTAELAKDSVAAAGHAVAGSSASAWEKTKHAVENVAERIMHAGAAGEAHVETAKPAAAAPINVKVIVQQEAAPGFFARLPIIGTLLRWSGSLIARTPLAPLLRLTTLGLLTLLGLMALPLFFMRPAYFDRLAFWRRNRMAAAAPAANINRPQVVPVMRPVGYTVVNPGATAK